MKKERLNLLFDEEKFQKWTVQQFNEKLIS